MTAANTAPNLRTIAFLCREFRRRGAVHASIKPTTPRTRRAADPQREHGLPPERGISGTLRQEGFAVENSVTRLTVFLRRGRDGGDPLAQRRVSLLQRAEQQRRRRGGAGSLFGTIAASWKRWK